MEDIEKTQVGRFHQEFNGTDDVTMPGRRDRKPDGRFYAGDLIINRYKVLSELGQGGMGVVYKCFDETAGIEVALKALPPELSHNTLEMEDIKENFQLVSKLIHQNIAISKNLEYDNSNGNYYLIMECVNGEDLRRWIKRKRKENTLNLENILPVIRQIAEALDYAHEEKIIHRDIKPGNIMIDSNGHVKILDFGLAAQIHTSMTRVSMAYHGTSGTGPYMAPEQWRGRSQGAAADQYALAVMTYEMLAGHLPFECTDVSILQQAVLTQEPEEISGIPSSAKNAMHQAMSKEPADRFPTCTDFADALSGNKKISAKKECSPRKKILTASVIITILLICAAGYWYHVRQEKIRQAREFLLAEQKRLDEDRQREEEKQREERQEEERRKEEQQRLEEEQRLAQAQKLLAEEKQKALEQQRLEEERAKEAQLQKIKAEAYMLSGQAQEACRRIKPEDFEQNPKFSELYQNMKKSLDDGENALKAENFSASIQSFELTRENVALIDSQCPRKKAEVQKSAVQQMPEKNDSIEELIDEAKVQISSQKWAEAHSTLKKILRKDSANHDVFSLLDIYGQGFYEESRKAMDKGEYRKAIALLEQMRPAIDGLGEYLLGSCYDKNHNVEQAKKHMMAAAKQNNADALFWLGESCSAAGDTKQAFDYFKQAADQGNTHAFLSLAIFYLDKSSKNFNEKEGIKYMTMAAEAGIPAAQYNLGCCYAKFKGADYPSVPYDRERAIQWLKRAKANNIAIAERALRRLED